jgi:hypothetical protein
MQQTHYSHRRHARNACFACLAVLATLFAAQHSVAQFSPNAAAPVSAYSIPQAQLMQPEALNHLLKAGGADKPLVIQVGSRIFFAQTHIVGAEFAGPGSQSGGLQLLQDKLATTKKGKLIVLYCGCCPWNRCPNVGPAYKLLRDLGFTNVKVLYLAGNFGDDWVAKGYPVEHGE